MIAEHISVTMKAAEFNAAYNEMLIQPLIASGFVQRGAGLFIFDDLGVLALLRYQDKWSALAQHTLFTVCVRHTFVRDLERQSCDRYTHSINDYPFKIQPSKLVPDFFHSPWHYQPCNLGHWPQDKIQFGTAKDVTSELQRMRDSVRLVGMSWLRFLDPTEAHRQISQYGESAYCEKIWLEDYEKFASEKRTSVS
jgi:hypothetical protein